MSTINNALRSAHAAPPVASGEANATPLLSECTDKLGRPLKDLRLSVIDQCNFRCTYCMPKEVFTKDYPFLRSASRLSFDQMTSLARALVRLGVEKIRITGGEPLLRKDLETLIEETCLPSYARRQGRRNRAHDEWFVACRKGPFAARCRSAARDRQPRQSRRCGISKDERRRLPGCAGPGRHSRGSGGGPVAGKGQHRCREGREREPDLADRAVLSKHGRRRPLYRVHGRWRCYVMDKEKRFSPPTMHGT